MNSETVLKDRLKELIGDERPYPWAERIGISPATFTRMWNEGVPPKADSLIKISEATGVSIDWLLTGQEPMWRADLIAHTKDGKVLIAEVKSGYGQAFDKQMMQDIIEAIEESLDDAGEKLIPSEKAKLIVKMYEVLKEDDAIVDKSEIRRFLKLGWTS